MIIGPTNNRIGLGFGKPVPEQKSEPETFLPRIQNLTKIKKCIRKSVPVPVEYTSILDFDVCFEVVNGTKTSQDPDKNKNDSWDEYVKERKEK